MAPTELRADIIPPTLFAMTHGLEQDLLRLVADENLRVDLRQRAQTFLRPNWEPGHLALRYLRLVRGDVPADWLVDPATIHYVRGHGMPDQLRGERIRRIIVEAGSDALYLTEIPDLERRLRDCADRLT